MTIGRQAALGVAAIAVLAAAVLIGRDIVSSPTSPSPARPATPANVTFHDAPAGFSISYPRTWTPRAADAQTDLLVASDTGVSMLVRVTPIHLAFTVTPENVSKLRPVADRQVEADQRVHQVRPPRKVVLDGVPGYLYLYTFRSGVTGRVVAHAHYILFKGNAVIALVFQVDPAPTLVSAAPMLDRVARTFRATPG